MFYWLARTVLGPLVRLIYRPWIKGAANIPAKGPAILASNHLAVFDSVFVPVLIPRRVFYIAKSDYFTGRGLKGRLTAGFMKGVGMIPVDRSGGRAAGAALEQGKRVLKKRHVFGIYPEGTRSPDGRLYRGKTGVARLALETGAPVLPVAMIGTNLAQPAGKRLPKLIRVGIVVGEPIDLSRYRGMDEDRFVLREVTDQIMFQIMRLSGQEYVDVYAATMKARLASGAPAPASETADAAPGSWVRPLDLAPPEPPEPEVLEPEAPQPEAPQPVTPQPEAPQPEAPQPGPPGPEPADAESAGPERPGPERPEPEAAGDEDQDRQPPKWKRWLRRGAGGPGTASDPAE